MNLWLTIIVAGGLTYAIRLAFIAAHGRIEMPLWFTRALTFVPVAVLSAIIFPELFTRNAALDLTPGNARLPAGLIATVIAWRTKNIWLTIAAGMLVLFAWQAVFAGS